MEIVATLFIALVLASIGSRAIKVSDTGFSLRKRRIIFFALVLLGIVITQLDFHFFINCSQSTCRTSWVR